AVVPRDVNPVLGAEVQELLALRIFADRAGEVGRADAVGDRRPGRAVVVRAEDVWLEVVHLVPVGCDVRRTRTKWRRLDQTDTGVVAETLRRDVLPVRAAIARDEHESIVRACPDEVRVLWRRRDREDGRVRLDAGIVLGDRPARRTHRLRIVPREIRADLGP